LLFLKEIGVINVFIRTEGNPNMKNSRNITLFTCILAVGIFAALMLRAQETAMPVQEGAISLTDTNVDWNSMSDLEVELKAIESVPPMPADSLPEAGTFWSAQHAPGTAEEWPPLPTSFGMSAWSLGDDGVFLLSDLNHVYGQPKKSKSATTSLAGGMMTMDVDMNPGDGGDDTNSGGGSSMPEFTPVDYGTNLWLQITNLTSGMADLLVSNTLADVQYEIQAKGDLLQTNWISEGFFLGSEITNWTPTSAIATNYPNLFYRIRSWQDSDGSGLPDWWQLQYFGHTGVDPYADPDGDGWNNLQEFQNGTDPTVFNTPPTPQGVTASYNAANGTATVNWLASPGAVADYKVIINGVTNSVSTNTLTLTEAASNDPYSYFWDGPNAFLDYQVEADYEGGQSVQSDLLYLELDSPNNVHVIPGPAGSAYLAANVSALAPGTTAVRLTRFDQYGDEDTVTNFDVPLSAFTNGLYLLPTAWVTSQLNEYDQWWVETVANGSANSAANVVSYYPYPDGLLFPAYLDGRAQLKQNLIFQLRAATENGQFEFTEINLVSDNYVDSILYPNNYAYSGFYQLDDAYGSSYSPDYVGAGAVDPYWPFHNNVRYENFVFNSTNLTSGGYLNTGVDYDNHYLSVNGGTLLLHPLTFEFQIHTNYSSMLATNQTRWLLAYPIPLKTSWDTSPIGFATNSSGGWTFASSAHNYWGLPFISAKLAYNNSTTTTLNPGDSYSPPTGVSTTWAYMETAQPQFSTVEYDFWDSSPVPGSGNFSPTNTSDLLVVPVDGSIGVNGYAKLSVQNGYSGVYGYLGQYFDKAYKITNGIVTTNTTGVLSPYGNFFATEPGPTALVTMPDVDTGARGTGVVYSINVQLDRNQGSNMDLSFNGADATSASSPEQIWVNNNYDRFKWDADDATNYEDDLGPVDIAKLPAAQQVPDCQYTTSGFPAIPCTRDLEDYFRLWTPGVAALMKVLPSNYTVQLTLSGAGQVRIFQAVEPDGGTNYLFDVATASNQVANSTSLYVGLLTSSSPIVFNISTNFNEHFIFCGAAIGGAQIDLQILDANQNVIADAPAFLQINDIKQMYERWTVGETPSQTPASVAVKAVDGVTTAFQYTPPTSTNTPYILLVHGWNLETWEKDRWAETAFKRLYWQGYQGRFGEFRWPTAFDFTGSLSDLIFDPKNYDNSEFNAWYSGYGLLSKLNDLNAEYPGNVYLMAHSMGNVVAGEALRLAGTNQVANTYVAMQGAVPAHCYDTNATTRTIPYPFDSGTPNRYAHYYTDTSPNYFNGIVGAGSYINFFNTNDFALSYWQTDQNLKPDTGFSYSGTNFFAGGSEIDFPSATYEIFAYADEARCYALGAQLNVGGAFKVGAVYNQLDLFAAPYNFGRLHVGHSLQFRLDYPQSTLFWNTLLSKMKLN
jgi:hypothetical protein